MKEAATGTIDSTNPDLDVHVGQVGGFHGSRNTQLIIVNFLFVEGRSLTFHDRIRGFGAAILEERTPKRRRKLYRGAAKQYREG